MRGNLGLLTQVSSALLATDTTPATFWVTNPNNTIEGNHAAGGQGGGGRRATTRQVGGEGARGVWHGTARFQ